MNQGNNVQRISKIEQDLGGMSLTAIQAQINSIKGKIKVNEGSSESLKQDVSNLEQEIESLRSVGGGRTERIKEIEVQVRALEGGIISRHSDKI